jgi:hypothetical protein
MKRKQLQPILEAMEPEEALAALVAAVRKLFPLLGEEARRSFMVDLVGAAGDDKVSSMVHL